MNTSFLSFTNLSFVVALVAIMIILDITMGVGRGGVGKFAPKN